MANWPKVLDKAVTLGPAVVLPGHGAVGGVEIVTGQAQFLRDLYAAVKAQIDLPVSDVKVTLPELETANWVRPDMSQHVGIIYAEIKAGKPAGALPHTWQ